MPTVGEEHPVSTSVKELTVLQTAIPSVLTIYHVRQDVGSKMLYQIQERDDSVLLAQTGRSLRR